MSEERCICCGAIIPEGRQVCPACENSVANKLPKGYIVMIEPNHTNDGINVKSTKELITCEHCKFGHLIGKDVIQCSITTRFWGMNDYCSLASKEVK